MPRRRRCAFLLPLNLHAAVPGPAALIGALGLLRALGNLVHPRRLDAEAGEVGGHRLRAIVRQSDVVLHGTARVGEADDGEAVVGVGFQAVVIFLQKVLRIVRQRVLIEGEVYRLEGAGWQARGGLTVFLTTVVHAVFILGAVGVLVAES